MVVKSRRLSKSKSPINIKYIALSLLMPKIIIIKFDRADIKTVSSWRLKTSTRMYTGILSNWSNYKKLPELSPQDFYVTF